MLSKQTQNNCSLRSPVSLEQCRVLWAGGHDFQGQESYQNQGSCVETPRHPMGLH